MTDAMEALYLYAQERLEPVFLLAEPQYMEVQNCIDWQEQQLRASISDEARQYLDNLLDEQQLHLFFEKQALFLAGFRLAMELSR